MSEAATAPLFSRDMMEVEKVPAAASKWSRNLLHDRWEICPLLSPGPGPDTNQARTHAPSPWEWCRFLGPAQTSLFDVQRENKHKSHLSN